MGARRGGILLDLGYIRKCLFIIFVLAANGYETSKDNLKIKKYIKTFKLSI